MKEIIELKQQYEKIVSQYVAIFCKKHEIYFESWVCDIIGETACFGDVLYFNFLDIVYDINTNQPKDLIIEWLYYCLDNKDKTINFYSYSKGLRY